ncbi:GNAT family N-acetyltransferase [Thalassococcus sp. BH17M4-6]|uniref:GNAT family N-acetyltransferase n=1 Tax=Thalassococcus sp. BH17M4-6 TaxID=3413148 RepID=UPI003BCD72B2
MTTAPVISTARLRLRPHRMDDLEPFWAFYQTPRAAYVGAPKTRTHLFYGLSSEVVSWDWMGHGAWAIDSAEGELIGQVAITRPPHFPEREIGWTLFEGHEGKGYAFEAATAALNWAWAEGFDTLVSYITPENAPSIALAERLGATHDSAAALPDGETAEETVVYRHMPDADGSSEAYA